MLSWVKSYLVLKNSTPVSFNSGVYRGHSRSFYMRPPIQIIFTKFIMKTFHFTYNCHLKRVGYARCVAVSYILFSAALRIAWMERNEQPDSSKVSYINAFLGKYDVLIAVYSFSSFLLFVSLGIMWKDIVRRLLSCNAGREN